MQEHEELKSHFLIIILTGTSYWQGVLPSKNYKINVLITNFCYICNSYNWHKTFYNHYYKLGVPTNIKTCSRQLMFELIFEQQCHLKILTFIKKKKKPTVSTRKKIKILAFNVWN
jgi:hypothetical protein